MDHLTPISLDQIKQILRAGSAEQAFACLDHLPDESSAPASETFFLRVWALGASGQIGRAAELLLPTVQTQHEADLAAALQGTELRSKAPVWFLLGALASHHGSDNDALAHYHRCLSALNERRMDLPFLRLKTLRACGSLCLRQRAFAQARDFFTGALPLCGDDQESLPCLLGVCEAHLGLGAHAQVQQWAVQALWLARTRGNDLAQISLLSWIAEARGGLGDLTGARDSAQEACDLARTLGRRDLEVESLARLASLSFQQAAYTQARERGRRALELSKETTVRPQVAGMLRRIMGDCLRQEISSYEPESEAWKRLVRQTFSWYRAAAGIFEQSRAQVELAEMYRHLASFALEVGQPEEASSALQRALAAFPQEAL